MTANIFFPRKVNNIIRVKIIGSILIIVITVLLIWVGNHLSDVSSQIDCSNFQTQTPPTFTEVICRDLDGAKIDCIETLENCNYTKYDITIFTKFGLLAFGFVFGYFFWPQIEQGPIDPPD